MAGRVAEALAQRLRDLGLHIDADDLVATQGFHRTDSRSMACRWSSAQCRAGDAWFEYDGGKGIKQFAENSPVELVGWDTMTQCAKLGVTLSLGTGEAATVNVYSKG